MDFIPWVPGYKKYVKLEACPRCRRTLLNDRMRAQCPCGRVVEPVTSPNPALVEAAKGFARNIIEVPSERS